MTHGMDLIVLERNGSSTTRAHRRQGLLQYALRESALEAVNVAVASAGNGWEKACEAGNSGMVSACGRVRGCLGCDAR